MAPSEHPETPSSSAEPPAMTGIQAPAGIAPPSDVSSIPLPSLPHPPTIDSAKFLRLRGGLDAMFVVLVLLFAFLVASFPASNPDFFRQLATGRLLLHGEYHFGVDPFVYSAGDVYYVNHSWLFALLMYGLYQLPTVGGAVVVIFKAFLIAVLAVVLLRTGRRAGQSSWIPAACTALALLVLSSRLSLHSTCLSLLFLGVTLWLLVASRPWWLLPPLFALWANCDAWFFLGPLTMALYLAGESLQQWLSSSETSTRLAAPAKNVFAGAAGWWVFAAGMAACLLNPHHIHAFRLPPELGLTAAGDLIENDPQFRASFLSPLRKEYYEPYLGLSVAGLAYWPLLLLSLVSFVFASLVDRSTTPRPHAVMLGGLVGRVPLWRLLVWLCFALLSLYNVRGIPFFAIVAGPIMALNWLDYAAGRLGDTPRLSTAWRTWSLGGRAVTALAAIALLIATVPGWLQAQPHDRRRLGWDVRVDPSLETMARTIHDWRQAGRLPDEPHWFNMQYEVANYLAYFAPGERVFLDPALPQFRKTAEDYLTIRRGLEQMVRERSEAENEPIGLKKNWRKVLHDHGVRYWIYDNIGTHKADAVAGIVLFANPEEWVLCYLKGRIAIFAWRDPQSPDEPDPARGLALHLKRAAFGPEAEAAPPRGPEQSSRTRPWWDAWWQPPPPLSIDRDSLALYDYRFQYLEEPRRMQQIYLRSHAWQAGVAAGAIARSLPCGPLPNSLLALSWSCTYNDLFPPGAVQPARPVREPEQAAMFAWRSYLNAQPFELSPSLYLGIRAARRALLINHEDGPIYFRLGQAYERLGDRPQERNLRTSMPRLTEIRRTQMVAAFQNYLRLQPDGDNAAQVHEALFQVFAQMGYLDAAVPHLRQGLDRWTATGPPPGVSATQFNQRLDRMSAELTRLDAELERRLNRYEVNAASKSGLSKVKVALELGLTETALVALEQAGEGDVNTQADLGIVKQVMSVALDLGRLDKARELLIPDSETVAGQPVRPDDVDLHVRLAAARGDYAEADHLLADALRHAWEPLPGQPMLDPSRMTAEAVGRVLLGEALRAAAMPRLPSAHPLLPSSFWIRRWRLDAVTSGLYGCLQHAEWYVLRGWLALESGRCVEAHRQFQAARAITVPFENWAPETNRVNAWMRPDRDIPEIQQLGFRHSVLRELSERYVDWLGQLEH